MNALNDVRNRMTPMMALTGAAAIATAVAVGSPPVQHAVAQVAPAVVHEMKSLQVQLTGLDPFYPFYSPVSVPGIVLTVPLQLITVAVQDVLQGTTQLLSRLPLDPRLTEQPALIAQALIVPVAVAIQGGVTSLLGGTYVLGRFTPAQALNFIVSNVVGAITTFINAEKTLLSTPLPTAAKAPAAAPDVAAPVAAQLKSLTLSTDSATTPKKLHAKHAAGDSAPAVTSDASATKADADTAKKSATKPTHARGSKHSRDSGSTRGHDGGSTHAASRGTSK